MKAPTWRAAAASSTGVLLVMLLIWTISNLDQSLFGYAVPGILQEFAIGLEAIGGILSLAFLTASACVVLAGLAADRYGRRRTLVVLLVGSAFFVGLHGYAHSVLTLTLYRSLAFGLAAGVAPITAAYVAEAAPARHRGMLMGVLQCGYPLGWFFAAVLAAPLMQSTGGWRSIFLIDGALGTADRLVVARESALCRLDGSSGSGSSGIATAALGCAVCTRVSPPFSGVHGAVL